ncbi:MAG TPA: hypothetical protein VF467_12200, partial [Afipia sp.]
MTLCATAPVELIVAVPPLLIVTLSLAVGTVAVFQLAARNQLSDTAFSQLKFAAAAGVVTRQVLASSHRRCLTGSGRMFVSSPPVALRSSCRKTTDLNRGGENPRSGTLKLATTPPKKESQILKG